MTAIFIPPKAGSGGGGGGLTDVTGSDPIIVTPFGTDRVVGANLEPPSVGTGGLPPGMMGSMARRRIEFIAAMDNTTTMAGATSFGPLLCNPASVIAVAAANTSYYASAVRNRFTSVAAINSSVATEIQSAGAPRGVVAGAGGYVWEIVWGFQALNADSRFLCGIAGSSTANSDPSSNLANNYCFAFDAADTNFQFMHNDATVGSCQKIDLGSTFPRPTAATDVYYACISCQPAAATIEYFLMRMDDPTKYVSGSVGWDLPANSTIRPCRIALGTGPTAAVAVSLDFMRAQMTATL